MIFFCWNEFLISPRLRSFVVCCSISWSCGRCCRCSTAFKKIRKYILLKENNINNTNMINIKEMLILMYYVTNFKTYNKTRFEESFLQKYCFNLEQANKTLHEMKSRAAGTRKKTKKSHWVFVTSNRRTTNSWNVLHSYYYI